jgi:hypothetical protein
MTLNQATWVVVLWGSITVVMLLVGPSGLAAGCALLHTCGIVGTPLAITLHRQVRSVLVVVAMAFSLSLALTALTSQALVWFSLANGPLIVVAATINGVVLGHLATVATGSASPMMTATATATATGAGAGLPGPGQETDPSGGGGES